MSFIYSRALVVESLPEVSLGIDASARLKSTHTHKKSSSQDKRTGHSRRSPSLETFEHSMLNPSEDALTLFLAAFPARTSVAPGLDPESLEQGQDFGKSLQGWFAKLSQSMCEWRTPQTSLLEGSELFSETWPRWGSMRNGVCYLRQTLAHTICVSASGSLLPTLTVNGNNNRPYAGKKSGYGLATAIALLPTLTTIGLNGGSKSRRATAKRGEPPTHVGPLNPDWCEWFMGFPIGWTEFTALETAKFQEWLQQHGECLEAAK